MSPGGYQDTPHPRRDGDTEPELYTGLLGVSQEREEHTWREGCIYTLPTPGVCRGTPSSLPYPPSRTLLTLTLNPAHTQGGICASGPSHPWENRHSMRLMDSYQPWENGHSMRLMSSFLTIVGG